MNGPERLIDPVIATFLTVGFPDRESTLVMIGAMVEGGADIIELGAPFSDPLAEGPTVQRSSQVALDQNITLADCLDCCRNARSRFPDVPLILMGYYNPLLSYGLDRFAEDASEAGLDGLIVVDLPFEEAGPLQSAAKARGMDFIFLLAPTSTEERIKRVAAVSSGFVYCVGLTGVTGARREMGADLPEFLGRVRAETDLPLLVGFGISTREHVERAASMSDGVAVGSALINLIEQSGPEVREENVRNFVRGLRAALRFCNRRVFILWCRGIRGAITATENSEEAILEATTELLQQMIKANDIEVDQIASATFTTTVDLNAEYPAVAARRLGWVDTALLCGHEMNVPKGLKKVVRAMVLINTEKTAKDIKHVYMKDARKLRPDNAGPAYIEEAGSA